MLPPLLKNLCPIISSIFGLFAGSRFKIIVIRSFAASEIGTWS